MSTKLALSEERLKILSECMQNYDVGADTDEWPNNIISRFTSVYNDGSISKHNIPLQHEIDPDELKLCQKLSAEIANIMTNVEVGMGSNSGDYFQDFYIMHSQNSASQKITPQLIQKYFANTIFPLANITTEPLTTNTQWWKEVEQDGEESPAEYFQPWHKMINWFAAQHDFIDCAFVRIGDSALLEQINSDNYPKGTIITGCVLPRLALGLTQKSSLVGIFGYVVHS
ncbi:MULTISPECIES: hypothetical protein [Acinetobacter]|uniref:hypothetical protein n=1 Tax=Acinetobacter TaxID=469 RepID=UPI000FBAD548|nr:hypothetical protein [Acinetobacter sp. RIT698]